MDISCSKLEFSYLSRPSAALALSVRSLVIPSGVTAVVGSNGSGKTTLLKLLGGVNRPRNGTVRIGGFGAPTAPHVRTHVAAVFDKDGLYSRLTGWENLEFHYAFYAVPPIEAHRRVQPWLDRWGLTAAMTQRVGGWSRGMRQKLALIRALALDTEVILLDEAWGGLSSDAREDLFQHIANQQRSQQVVVFTSHDSGEVMRLAQRVVLLEGGRVRWQGWVRDLSRLRLRVTIDPDIEQLPSIPYEYSRAGNELFIDLPEGLDVSSGVAVLLQAGLRIRSVSEETMLTNLSPDEGASPGRPASPVSEEPRPE